MNPPSQSQATGGYVLVTAAYNEERYIEQTVESVIAQTVLPKKWVIVSDGSTDRTDEIVRRYAAKHSFVMLHRITEEHPRNFAAQVNAINAGYSQLAQTSFDFIGNLDADVSMEPTYYQTLLTTFAQQEKLGLTGGFIFERKGLKFCSRRGNSAHSVAHAIQFFRRECYETIGPYLPLPYGGPDYVAEVRARQFGWEVASFPDLPVYHYRPTAGAEGLVKGRLRQGHMDYSVGGLLLFELLKCLRRIGESPKVVGALVRFYGFASLYARRAPRLVPNDFVDYLQSEQRQRLRAFLGRVKAPS